jgi:outer membrane protein
MIMKNCSVPHIKTYFLIIVVIWMSVPGAGSGQTASGSKTSFSLTEAQSYAVEHNLNVQNARLDVEAARQRIWENTASGLPQISATASYTNNLQLMTTLIPAEFFQGEPGTYIPVKFGTQHNATANVIADQLLFNGPYIVGLQAASTYRDLTQKTLDKKEADIREGVAQSYYSVLLAESSRDAFWKNLQTMKDRLEETRAMFKAGFLEETDVDQIQIAVSTLENEYIAANQLVEISYRYLVYRMGYDLDTNLVITDNLVDIIGGLTKNLIEQDFNVNNHYDYRILNTREKLAMLQVKMNRFEYMPTLSARLNHQEMAMRNHFNFADPNEKWYPATTFGLNLSVPIFSSGMRRARIGQSEIDLEKTRNQKKDLVSALELQVQQSRINFRTAYQKYLNQRSNIELAQKIFEQMTVKYQHGLVSSLDMTLGTEQITAAQTGYISAMVELLNAKLALDKALGNL